MKKQYRILWLVLAVCLMVYGISGAVQSVKFNDSPSGVAVVTQDESGITLELNIGEIDFFDVMTAEGQFTMMNIDMFTRSQRIGEPSLPMLNKLLSIPFEAELQTEIVNFTIEEISLTDLGIQNPIIPVQPSLSKSQNPADVPFEYKAEIYSLPGFYELPLVSSEYVGIMRHINLGQVTLAPIQYNAMEHRLKVYTSLTVRMNYVHPNMVLTQQMQRKYYSPFFEPVSNLIINYEQPSSLILDDLTRYPVKYLIISARMFEAQLQPFIEWKTKQGFYVTAAYTDEIGFSNTQIKSYIQQQYNDGDPIPSFVLLVGDAQQIPPFSHGSHISDLDFCLCAGGDHIPDIYYGRWSAQNTQQLQPQIDKTLEYERYEMPDPSYLGEVTMIAGVDDNFAPIWGNGQINYGTSLYFNSAHGITSNTWLFPASDQPGAAAAIRQTVNEGVGFINYTAHGSHDGWADPSFSSTDVRALTNAHKYTTAVGNCCLTSTFGTDYSSPCVGEYWLMEANKGAIGYIGGSNSSYWDEDYWYGVGYGPIVEHPEYEDNGLGAYDGMFHDHSEPANQHYVTNGAVNYRGCLAVQESNSSMKNYYWEIYHLFGDPSLATYLGVPSTNNVIHDPVVLITATSFTVAADPGSYVGISFGGIIHGAGYIGQDGTIDVELIPFGSPGTADIVVTCQNREPIISTIQVITPVGPYVIFDSCVVNDASGNNNGLIDCGENIVLGVQLINVGPDQANGVSAVLSTTDSYIIITDSMETYGNIPGNNGLANSPNAFAFGVSTAIPDDHSIRFLLTVSGTALDTWISNINLVAHAPLLEFVSVLVNDQGGNNNGILDPGETATLLVTLNNGGSGQANSVSGVISETDNFVTVSDANGSFGNIAPGGQGNNAGDLFTVSADQSCPMGHAMIFHLAIDAGGTYTTNIDFDFTVGNRIILFYDDFSVNTGWTGLGGQAQWAMGPAVGGSGGSGGPDPSQDVSPTDDDMVLGNNLGSSNGAYVNNISAINWVTSTVIDCSNSNGIIMTYYHWLGVESNSYDHAYFQAFDGTSWVELFSNGSTSLNEQSWIEENYDLSAIADNNPDFQLRFGLGSTDGSVVYCGWNIDDITLRGYSQSSGGNPELSFTPVSFADSMLQGDQEAYTLKIRNTGDAILRVMLTTTDSWIEFQSGMRSIDPYDSVDVSVNLNAANLGPGLHAGDIDFTSNDTDHPTGTVPCNVYIYQPDIHIPQTTVGDTLLSGEQSSVPLIIRNEGPGRLIYDINCQVDELMGYSRRVAPTGATGEYDSGDPEYRITDLEKGGSLEPFYPPIILDSGGPDAFGYKWIDSDEPNGPAYGWVDISASGFPINLTDDSYSAAIGIGFEFPFYENSYSQLYIGSNGILTFGVGSSALANTTLPNSSIPNNLIAMWWDDLNPGDGGGIYYYYDSDNNRFIVSFVDIRNYRSGGGTGSLTFEAILYPSGKIALQYGTMDPGLDADGLAGSTIGIENSGGTIGLQVVYDADYMHDDLAIKITADEWLEVEPEIGTIEPYSRDTVMVLFNAAELAEGQYTGQIAISSNDPVTPLMNLQVALYVGEYGGGCPYVVGDVNGSGIANGLDVVYLVNYLKGSTPPPGSCDCPPHGILYVASDANGTCSVNGLDATYMVNYFKGGPDLIYCSDCPPTGQFEPIGNDRPAVKPIPEKKGIPAE